MTNLDMDTLRTFVKGIELGSFAKAATTVGRSQSAVSGQLRKLEEQVGETLFRRTGRGLTPTPAGSALLGYARRILELNDEALDTIRLSHLDGTVKLGLPADFAETWLPRVLARFARSHPRVLIEIQADRSSKLAEHVATGQLDLALAWEEASPGGYSEILASIPTGWIVPANFSSASRLNQPLPLVTFDDPCVFRRLALSALEAQGTTWRLAFVSPSLPGLWAAVDAGLGIAMRTAIALPSTVNFLQHSDSGLPALPPVSLSLHKSGARLSSAATALAALVAETITSSYSASDT